MSRKKLSVRFSAGIAGVLLIARSTAGADIAAQPAGVRQAAASAMAPAGTNDHFAAGFPEQRLSYLRRASDLVGTTVWDGAGDNLGKIEDFVVDWNSGRVFCALVLPTHLYGSSNYFIAIPARCFLTAESSGAQIGTNLTTLIGLPRFIHSGWDAAGVSRSLAEAYRHFNQPVFWDEKSGLPGLGRYGDLLGTEVNNQANVNIGDLVDLTIDLPAGRMLLAVISFYGDDDNQHAVPFEALNVSSKRQNLVLDVNDSMVGALVDPDDFLGVELTDPVWVADNFRDFGRQPDFDTSGLAALRAGEKNAIADLENPPLVATRPELVRSDSELSRAVMVAFIQADMSYAALAPALKVSADHGQVTLSGTVDNEKQKSNLGTIAESVAGVGNVKNALVLK